MQVKMLKGTLVDGLEYTKIDLRQFSKPFSFTMYGKKINIYQEDLNKTVKIINNTRRNIVEISFIL